VEKFEVGNNVAGLTLDDARDGRLVA